MHQVIHTKLGAGRRVAIPAELCKEYGLEPGSPVVLEPSASGIVVRPLDAVIREVQAFFAGVAPPEVSLSEELIRDRRAEAGGKRVTEAVLDASALVAFLRQEPGAEQVAAVLSRCCLSAVNLAETLGKMVEYGQTLEAVAFQVERLQIPVIPFDAEQARIAASLWKRTRRVGLSLGDRACLALALHRAVPALTADQGWEGCDLGVEIRKIR